MSIYMVEDFIVKLLGFINEMTQTFIQHTTLGFQNLDTQLATAIDSVSEDVIL